MMQFAALNKQDSGSSSLATAAGKSSLPTREAQESACLQLYHAAMKHQQEGKLAEAHQLYCELLQTDLLSELPPGESKTSTLYRLKFLILKNLAAIAKEKGDVAASISAYTEAAQLDKKDLTLWYQLALAACSLGDLPLAKTALEQVLECNSRHWPAINLLCNVLLALGNYAACMQVSAAALEIDPNFARGLAFFQHTLPHCPECAQLLVHSGVQLHLTQKTPPETDKFLSEVKELETRYRALRDVQILREDLVPLTKLTQCSAYALGKFLLAIYQQCQQPSSGRKPSFSECVDLSRQVDGACERTGPPSPSPSKRATPVLAVPKANKVAESDDVKRESKKRTLSESDFFIAPKRRSTRVKSKGREPVDVFLLFKKYIPSIFKMQFLPDLLAFSHIPDNTSAAKMSPSATTAVDFSEPLPDVEIVKDFMEDNQTNSGITYLMLDFLSRLADHYQCRWSTPLTKQFIECYEILHKHLSFPSLFSDPSSEGEREYAKKLLTMSVCYVELKIDDLVCKSLQKKGGGCGVGESSFQLPSCFYQCKTFAECCPLSLLPREERHIMAARVEWFQVRWWLEQRKTKSAIATLERCRELLMLGSGTGKVPVAFDADAMETSDVAATGKDDKQVVVYLPNCKEDQVISEDSISGKITALKQSLSMAEVYLLYEAGKYDEVIDRLRPILDQESGSYSDFLLDPENDSHKLVTGLSMQKSGKGSTGMCLLLNSLQRTSRNQECLKNSALLLVELLQLHPFTECWASAINFVYSAIESCLAKEPSILKECDVELGRKLVTCFIKTVEAEYELADSTVIYLLPLVTPWKLFHAIMSCNHWEDTETRIIPSPGIISSHDSASDPTLATSPLPTYTSSTCTSPTHTTTSSTYASSMTPVITVTAAAPVAMEMGGGGEEEGQCSGLQEEATVSRVHNGSETYGRTTTVLEERETPLSSAAVHINVTPSVVPASQSDKKQLGLMFLKEAHAWLGSLGWCCHSDGVLLKYFIGLLRPELKSLMALPTDLRQELLVELEQCYYCLYNHPQKKAKARGLQEHNSDPVELTWEACQLLLEYFHPSCLPSIDDIKSPQVTPELISLYRRIIDAIPEDIGQVLSKDVLSEYINGTVDILPAPRPPQQHSTLISEIYYLLADDYLKSYDNMKAIDCYQSDLTYCPSRFDSWAGLALAWSRTITAKLDQRDTKKPIDKFIRKHAMPTFRCFKKAVSLNAKHCYMVEKFGFFCYSIQSYASQVLRQPHLCKTPDVENWALAQRRSMLEMSEAQFSHALSLGGTKHAEPWIYHFMLGKIGHKLGKSVHQVLDHFLQSAETLYVEGANYPSTVEVTSKGHAMEAVEVHYQLFSSALKYLEKTSDAGDDDRDVVESAIRETVDSVAGLPLGKAWYPDVWAWLQSVLKQYQEKKAASLLPPQTAQSREAASPATKSSFDCTAFRLQEEALGDSTQPKLDSLVQAKPSSLSPAKNATSPVPVAVSHDMQSLPSDLESSPSTLHSEFVTRASVTLTSLTGGVVSVPRSPTAVSTAVDNATPTVEDVRPAVVLTSPVSNSPSPLLQVICEEEPMEEGENVNSDIDLGRDPGRASSSDDSCEMNAVELAALESVSADGGQTMKEEESSPLEELWWSPSHEPLAQCLYSVAVCSLRSPAYFKSLYRLANTLTQLGLPQVACLFLLGPLPECFVRYQEKLLPLFVLKSNIFQNMWLIHVSEINRPGTFCSHARSCFLLLMSVLTKLKDLTSLIYVTQQTKSRPDSSRQFMRENERTAVYSKAVLRCVQVLEDAVASEVEVESSFEQQNKLLQEACAVRNMAARTEGGKPKVVDQCMVTIFSHIWSHPEVQQLFDEDTRSTRDPGIDLVLKYCHLKGK